MSAAGWTLDSLRECLLAIPAVELKGMALLRECRSNSGFFPVGIARTTMIEAVTEITAYTGQSRRMADALAHLTPIPLRGQVVLEYGL